MLTGMSEVVYDRKSLLGRAAKHLRAAEKASFVAQQQSSVAVAQVYIALAEALSEGERITIHE